MAGFSTLSPGRVRELGEAAQGFLAEYGTLALLGTKLSHVFQESLPENRFEALMAACGFRSDPQGFFSAVHEAVLGGAIQDLGQDLDQEPAQEPGQGVRINGIGLPLIFLYAVLEGLYPSDRLISVRTPQDLALAAGTRVACPEKLQKVLDLYPVRLSSHVARQSRVSAAVAAQYLPFEEELDPRGHTMTFEGHFRQGVVEQMYQNRVIFLLDMRCPVYCRFCFRKHKDTRKEKCPGPEDVARAVDRVRTLPEVREILITGGEPLLNRKNLDQALDSLMTIDHIETLRIATRSVAYYPALFLRHGGAYLNYLKERARACREHGKRLEIGIHMVHPDEISVQSLEIIAEFTSSGVPVYVQTPFLAGINDDGQVLGRLFKALRQVGAEIYYIFTPCHPIHGTQRYWSPISRALDAHCQMRATLSDRSIPKLCTATPLGKMEWHTSGWAVDRDLDDPDHCWIRTPYTRDYFRRVTGRDDIHLPVRENPDRTLDVKCLVDMGDDALFLGSHDLMPALAGPGPAGPDPKTVRNILCHSSALMPAAVASPGMRRVHLTRLEVDLDPEKPVQAEAVARYIESASGITDVMVCVRDQWDLDLQISGIDRLIKALPDSLTLVRIRWQAFQDRPEQFGQTCLEAIRSWAGGSIARPRQVEIETWWLMPDDITLCLEDRVAQLSRLGIPVYACAALISGLNTDPMLMAGLARRLRKAGMDFHHLYVAGLSVQNRFNPASPVTSDQVLAIASHIRKVCSGREIPLYMIWTPAGETDFGLASTLEKAGDNDGNLLLHSYTRAYLSDLIQQHCHPDIGMAQVMKRHGIKEAVEPRSGRKVLCLPITGLRRSGDFPL